MDVIPPDCAKNLLISPGSKDIFQTVQLAIRRGVDDDKK